MSFEQVARSPEPSQKSRDRPQIKESPDAATRSDFVAMMEMRVSMPSAERTQREGQNTESESRHKRDELECFPVHDASLLRPGWSTAVKRSTRCGVSRIAPSKVIHPRESPCAASFIKA